MARRTTDFGPTIRRPTPSGHLHISSQFNILALVFCTLCSRSKFLVSIDKNSKGALEIPFTWLPKNPNRLPDKIGLKILGINMIPVKIQEKWWL
jgi:hypothetical protein